MTNEQLYLAIGVPVILNIAFNGLVLTFMYNALKDTWRAELRRVEEVLDARLKHLEERFR